MMVAAVLPTMLLVLQSALAFGPGRDRPSASEIAAAVQPVLDSLARRYNSSFSFGYADGVDPSIAMNLVSVCPVHVVNQLGLFGTLVPGARSPRGATPFPSSSPFPPHPFRISRHRVIHTICVEQGMDDRCFDGAGAGCQPTKLATESLIPAGSVTKAITGVAVMREIEAGRLSWGDPAHVYIDRALMREENTTFRQLWNGNAAVERITVEDLLGMTSGIQDYDDNLMEMWTLANPGKDITPIMFLKACDKTLVDEPPAAKGWYSSINYVLLGYLMQGLAGLPSWVDWDQSTVIPADTGFGAEYRGGWIFPTPAGDAGIPCSSLPGVAHQYAGHAARKPGCNNWFGCTVDYFYDLEDNSCLNGWAMGNVASTGKNLAMFFRDLYSGLPDANGGPRLLSRSTVAKMSVFHPLFNSWCPGCTYGLASFGGITVGNEKVSVLGHSGQDWGSAAQGCGYYNETGFEFGACLVMNTGVSTNCGSSSTVITVPFAAANEANCAAAQAVLGLFGKKITCSASRGLPNYNTCQYLQDFPACAVCAEPACKGWGNCKTATDGSCAKFHDPGDMHSFCVPYCSANAC